MQDYRLGKLDIINWKIIFDNVIYITEPKISLIFCLILI